MPHVVLILVDALRADHLGCYAAKDLGTPHVDGLAREGVVFENAIAQAPSTRPSVASLMTGLYPSQHGLVDRWRMENGKLRAASLDHSIPTLAEYLGASGFATAAFLGGNANLKPLFGLTRGFTLSEWRPTTDGSVLVDDFERWLRSGRPERSFSYLHFMDVHHPLPADIPSRLDRGLDLSVVQESMDALVEYYRASVRRTDGHIGRVLGALEASGGLEDTLVIVIADHGEELMERGVMLAHGRTLYGELLRVPLVLRFAGAAHARTVVSQPVQLIDILPTMLDHIGRPPVDVPGRSLLPLVSGGSGGDRSAFSELPRRDLYAQSVVTFTHHLVETFILEEHPVASPADLEPGMAVEIKGKPLRDGAFVGTKVSMKSGAAPKVRGEVEWIDPATGQLSVMGLTLHVDPATEFVGLDQEPFRMADLAEGDKISATFSINRQGRRVLGKVKRRKLGGKSKIEGTVDDIGGIGGVQTLRVLGIEVALEGDVRVSDVRGRERDNERGKAGALLRVVSGDFIRRETELFDLADDPTEELNIAADHPQIVRALEAQLGRWTTALVADVRTSEGTVDVDAETLEQLRRMGYVD